MIALFIGRFQPFHKGHLHDIKEALNFSDKVIIGIGSSQEQGTTDNPFSFEERKEMIEMVLKKNNISDYEIKSIPDINDDTKWVDHVVSLIGNFDIAYTGNSWVKRLFQRKGIEVKDVILLKDITATEIRKRIDRNENWQDLVPIEVVDYIKKIEGVNRIKEIKGIL